MSDSAESPAAPKVPAAPKGVQTKVRIAHLHQMKAAGRPIVMVTAYDACFGALADEAGVDLILVGDSAGMVVHGYDTTLPVTVEMIEMHVAAVARGARRALIVADMPFMSYQVTPEEAVRNAGRFLKAGAQAVKIEGHGPRIRETVRALSSIGIPVIGHIGLVPQSVHALSGYRIQGKTDEEAERLMTMARLQQEAGLSAIVLECIPHDLARRITAEVAIPTIGIGAGPHCDGQVLVMHDLLGLTEHPPSFARKYLDLRAGTLRAFRKYARDVRERSFPEE
ncbi:MAG: 3-methyl-2-oxobutanoate hydroxymethyltransferase [Candidatus Sumerlaeia bacterium]|nr:3-methyl-2-oxobutanoate hydroxymethyltransferase [Candidatus Sumerlaeia bacterium]